jgi:hypothetical protein
VRHFPGDGNSSHTCTKHTCETDSETMHIKLQKSAIIFKISASDTDAGVCKNMRDEQ